MNNESPIKKLPAENTLKILLVEDNLGDAQFIEELLLMKQKTNWQIRHFERQILHGGDFAGHAKMGEPIRPVGSNFNFKHNVLVIGGGLDFFNFEAGQGQTLRHLFKRRRKRDEIPKPVRANFHEN